MVLTFIRKATEEGPGPLPDIGAQVIGGFTVNQLLMLLLAYRIAKMPKGMDLLKSLGKEFIKGMFGTLKALGHATAANKIAAWANPVLISGVLDHFGFLDANFIPNYHLGITTIAGVQITEDFVSVIANALPWNLISKAEDRDYPSVYAPGTDKETVTTKGEE